jgi:CRISPR-associated protein Cas2
MVVVVANHIPPAVRGRMKLWFLEPRANVFVSGIKDSVAETVILYLIKSCPPSSGLIVFQKINKAPGFKIWGTGETNKQLTDIDGYQFIVEKRMS